jgi:predicted alpha/beta hydrolase
VALEWSRWSRRKAYLLHPKRGHFPNYFDEFRGDILALSFTDDIVATDAAAEAFMHFYTKAASQAHWHINPKEHSIKSIGHSGFFRSACEPLWKRLIEWIVAH